MMNQQEKQQAIRLTAKPAVYSLMETPESNDEGAVATIQMTVDYVAINVDGLEQVMDRKVVRLYGITQAQLVAGLEGAKTKLYVDPDAKASTVQSQIDEINAL